MTTVLETIITDTATGVAIVLPKEALDLLGADRGQTILITEAPGGGLRLTRSNPDSQRQIQHAYEAMERYPEALKKLAQ